MHVFKNLKRKIYLLLHCSDKFGPSIHCRYTFWLVFWDVIRKEHWSLFFMHFLKSTCLKRTKKCKMDYENQCILCLSYVAAKSLQSCPTLCDPIDGSPPGSLVPGILQARTPEWVAISFSNAWKRKVKVKLLSRVRLLVTPWTAAYQAPLSMGFFRQEYWSGLPLPSPFLMLAKFYFQIKEPHVAGWIKIIYWEIIHVRWLNVSSRI